MFALMCIGFGISSCSSDDDEADSLSVTPTSITLSATGSENEYFDIECNTRWKIEVDEDWLEVSESKGNGNATIYVAAIENNPEDIKRTANVVITAGSLTKRVRVTQEAGQSLSVSPSNPQFTSEKGATGNLTITSNSAWSISGSPAWLTLSATQGTGNTTITMTTNERNFSENARSATLTIVAGSKSAVVTVTQAPALENIHVAASNELIISDGYYADLNFDGNVLGYVQGLYYSQAFGVKTEEEIYNEVLDGTPYNAEEYDIVVLGNLRANTEYVYCCIPYSGESGARKYGPMMIKKFTTKSNSTYSDAVVTATYNSTTWKCTVTKQQRCNHYYIIAYVNNNAEYFNSAPNVILAKILNDNLDNESLYAVNDKTYSYKRESDEYAFIAWTWGVNDKDEFSGNIRKAYLNTSSSAKPLKTNISNSTQKEYKYTKSQISELKKNLRVYYK